MATCDNVAITLKGIRYKVVRGKGCATKKCALFKSGVCDYDGDDKSHPKSFPCDRVFKMLRKNGLAPECDVYYVKG